MLTLSDEEKREAKAKKDEVKLKKIAEQQLGDDKKRLSTPLSQPGITPEDETLGEPESAVSESAPYFDAVSLEEPNEPASKTSRSEAASTNQEHSNKSPTEEPSGSVTRETNEANTVSEVDPSLLDPALRESVIDELSAPEKNPKELRSSDSSHAELVAARVLDAPVINDVPIEEATTAARDATDFHQDLTTDLSHPSEVTASEENHSRQNLAADPSHAAGTPNVINETDGSPSLSPDPSHPAKGIALDDITVQPDSVLDPSHASEATNTAPKSPKGESKVTTWLRSKFGRRTTKPHEPHTESSSPARVDLEDEEHHKEGKRKSQSVSSILIDEDAKENDSVLKQRKLSSREDFEEAHNHPDIGKSSEERATSGTSVDVGHTHDNHARDSKFQENL